MRPDVWPHESPDGPPNGTPDRRAAAGLLLVTLGNVLPRVRPNGFVGVRTPWTLADDRNWTRSQRVGGYALLGAGLLFLVAAAVPSARMVRVAVAGAVAAALGPLLYSYYVHAAAASE